MKVRLRSYQRDARARLEAAWLRGLRRILLVAPTGSGKTTVAADLIEGAVQKGTQALFVAHSEELIDQASGRLRDFGLPHGIIKSGRVATPEAGVQVASIATLIRREPPPAQLVVIDESHRAVASVYQAIIGAYPQATIIGLTATPIRLDGRGLGDTFEHLVEVARVEQLVAQGFLLRPRVLAPSVPDLGGLRIGKSGDYGALRLAAAMDKPHLVGDIVQTWQREGQGRRTIAFCASVEHSKHVAEAFQAAGVEARHLDGTTPAADRAAILLALAEGRVQVVCNYSILAEGYDCPSAAVCILARPTASLGLYLQMVGRVMRPADGKDGALVLDHAGCALRHGLPTTPRSWGLDATPPKRGGAALPSVRQCPKCYAVTEAGPAACPECGQAYPVKPAAARGGIRTKAGELRELTEDQVHWRGQPVKTIAAWKREHPSVRSKASTPEAQAALLRALVEYGAQRGYKPTWAGVFFNQVAGFWPDAGVKRLAGLEGQEVTP